MDFNFNRMNSYRRSSNFIKAEGIIVDIQPARIGNRRANGCMMFVLIEDTNGNMINFIITPATFVVDYTTLSEGMNCTFFYRADAPAPLIYPPQFNAVVVAPKMDERQFVSVGYFNTSLINEDQSLQLNMDSSVSVLTTNNQVFLGSPANHNLVVIYQTSTRSIPAQTTPVKVIVLCDES